VTVAKLEKVLVIDDEPDIRRVVELALKVLGKLQVALASSGAEGVEAAARERPDVILLDVMMPGTDGPATLELLRGRAETAAIPVIFLTAKVQPKDLEHLRAIGGIGVIQKPFDPTTLAREVRRLLEGGA
jgi:CheY-like chemotaxis protein